MACLKAPTLQGYIEEVGQSPLRETVESRLASCARCRAAFDRVLATHRRVNSWLAKLSLPSEDVVVDVVGALTRLRTRTPQLLVAYADRGTNPKALASSFLVQGAVVAILMLAGTNDAVRRKITQVTLIAPPIAKFTQTKTNHSGGGGQHAPLPPLKGQLPKPASRAFTAPLVTAEHPALVMDSSLIAPPDAWAAPTGAIGNPLGVFTGAAGPASRGGIGGRNGVGIGGTAGDGIGDGGNSGISNVGGGITPPELIARVEPEYSEEARRAKYSGAVTLSIIVNTDGRATDIKVVKSLGMGLDEKAIEAVEQWRFRPGQSRGVPVLVRAQVLVTFRLL